MTTTQTSPKAPLVPKICMTASGFLVHEGRVLLIKHKKLSLWLSPGGHIEDQEKPHEAAEREFFEEAGLRVKAYQSGSDFPKLSTSEYYPSPFLTNIHWVSRENYDLRIQSSDPSARFPTEKWPKGCEQHLGFMYLVRAVDGYDFKQNTEETDGIGWFGLSDLKTLEVPAEVVYEIELAIKLAAT